MHAPRQQVSKYFTFPLKLIEPYGALSSAMLVKTTSCLTNNLTVSQQPITMRQRSDGVEFNFSSEKLHTVLEMLCPYIHVTRNHGKRNMRKLYKTKSNELLIHPPTQHSQWTSNLPRSDRQTDRQTVRQTDSQTDRQTDREQTDICPV